MSFTPVKLSADALKRGLSGLRLVREIRFFPEVDSTNTVALDWAARNAGEGTLVVAEAQRAGRGRRGRTWYSPEGLNLTFSLLLRPGVEAARTPWLGLAAGLAVSDGIEAACGLASGVKWPNDVLIGGRKTAGILIEQHVRGMLSDGVVLGVGLNANMRTEDFPPDLRGTATSLRIESGRPVDRIGLLRELLDSIGRWYSSFLDDSVGKIRETYWERCTLRDAPVVAEYGGQSMKGRAIGLDSGGGLRLRRADGREVSLNTGEVHRVRPDR